MNSFFIVTVNNETTSVFFDLKDATLFAEDKAKIASIDDDGTVCFTSYSRVVIHKLFLNKEYSNDYLLSEEFAIKILNDY